MEEKDRHIITFDTDQNEEQLPKSTPETPKTEFTMTPSETMAPKVEPADEASDFILMPSRNESRKEEPVVAGDNFSMKPSEPEAPKTGPAEEASDFILMPSRNESTKEARVVISDDLNMKPSEPKTSTEADGWGFNMAPSPSENKAHELRRDFDAIGNDVKASMSETVTKAAGAVGSESTHSVGNHYAQKPVKQKKKKEKKYVTRGALVGCMILTMLLSTLLGSFLGAGLSGMDSNNSGRTSRDDSKLSQLNLGDATGSEMTVAEIVDKNADAVVEIVVSGTTRGLWGQLQLAQGAGSGVIIREDGYIATNYHVIEGANIVEVTLHNGSAYPAQIVGSDPSNDVAVIKIEEKGLTTATIGDSSTVEVGDLAVAIGNPLGQLGGTATTGIISALDRTLEVEGTTLTLLQTDAAINGGNSGGGLFNSKGELIGIVESKASAVGVEGLAFALPINSVAEIINNIIETGGNVGSQTEGTPAVGIVISDVSEEQSQYYGLDEPGVYIAQVTGENALKAGFKEQDRIVSFNGTEVKDSSGFISLVRKCKVGDTVTIVVSRQGQQIEIKTVLEELQTEQ